MNESSATPAALTIMLPGDVPMEFQNIPKGSFRMGSRGNFQNEEPIHRVVIPQDFYLGTFPVTQAQYRAMAEECREELSKIKGNKGDDPSYFKGDMRPVENVSWDEAMLMGRWLSRSDLLPIGWQAGLPSEAMWEYACRAGSETEYWSGDGEAALAEVGWYIGNSNGGSHQVGESRTKPNRFDLYDMHGNVWEWCADVYHEDDYRIGNDETYENNEAWDEENGCARVLCGGSWFLAEAYCRSACRLGRKPGIRDWNCGFRLCLFPGPVRAEVELTGQVGWRETDRCEANEPGDGMEWNDSQ